MNTFIGLLVAISAILVYSASGWLYLDANTEHSVVEVDQGAKLVQQNFDHLNQRSIRKQISECMRDSYQYLAMSMYFDQAQIALPGFHKMFKAYSDREMSNAIKLMNYMNLRDGSNKLTRIKEPRVTVKWQDGETALKSALRMEKKANTKFMNILNLVLEKHDPHLKQFIEDKFLDQKVKVIKELGDKITQLERCKLDNPGLGLQVFDNTLLN